MEEERAEDNVQAKSNSPLPTSLPINWALITGPVPVFPAISLSSQLPPPQSSAVHALQTKVKSTIQRRTKGRDRERERDRLDTDMLLSSPAGQTSSEVFLGQRPRGKGPISLSALSWRSGAAKNSSSSGEEEEVKVQVSFEIHSPPAEAKEEQLFQEVEATEEEQSEGNEGQVSLLAGRPSGLLAGTSLESLLSDNSSSSKDDPSQTPPPLPVLSSSSATVPASTSSSSSSSSKSYISTRHWAPPKGFWRVVRPETLLLNGVGPHNIPSTLPLKDYTQTEARTEPQWKSKPAETVDISSAGDEPDDSDASPEFKHSDSVERFLDRCEQKEADAANPAKGLCSSDSCESMSSQCGVLSPDKKLKVKQRAYARLRERQQNYREEREQSGVDSGSCLEDTTYNMETKVARAHGISDSSDSSILAQELEPYLRSLLVISDEHPLSPRHEQAKRLLEQARIKARSTHIKGDRPRRRSHSDQRSTVKKQQIDSPSPTPEQKAIQAKDVTAQTVSGPLLVPTPRDTSPGEQGCRSRRYGCSPTRVRFEDESEKEAESRYLDRVRQRGRTGVPKSKSKESNTDSSSSGSEKSRSNRSVSMPPLQTREDVNISSETTTVIKEIIVLVKKCEACGSVVREPQPVLSPSDPQNTEPEQLDNPEEPRGKPVPRCVPPDKPEASTRPKAPLTVTFAGAFILGENKETSTVWKSSGFGKLRRRSRKGESRLESGNGPYGPSWAQRRNSNPRNRVNSSRAVSFAPGSPITHEPGLLGASGGPRDSQAPSLPIKSALKSSSRNRSAASQSTVQFHIANQGGEGGAQHSTLLDSPDAKRESPVSLTQGAPASSSSVACIRPSTLRYSPARFNTDMPAAELWDATPDGTGLGGDTSSGPDCRPALRGQAMSRAEDLRAELLRAEHLKAEAIWEENSDGSRKLDGRPKLFLRRFFSSIGLNSVGRLVKGRRSNSMEQLSVPTMPRPSSTSPSPTRRPQPIIRIQRTPSLQTLHTVLPLAQLRKASSVQSLERRTERSTILGEVHIPYGLAPSPDSSQLELQRALSVEDILPSRIVRPVGRVTHAFPDGTLLLELVRPPNGPFGFVISRGKGRPDTGVYVEKVGDGGGEGTYVGLLGIGDEILQVNGEALAGLTLDQVTRLMTRESTASLRIMPARRNQR
ncbi:platelet binding protein GspB [Platichthys flesus]|uniref:platelet binding protein GspB n=1 Tax=Platichthys flesus TaxID=8260 RepID=UPI002DBE151F|nr:platelet binding protein GspB [Platichthys flesus]